jgi:hypothetical protein
VSVRRICGDCESEVQADNGCDCPPEDPKILAAHRLGDLHAALTNLVEEHGAAEVTWALWVALSDRQPASDSREAIAVALIEQAHEAGWAAPEPTSQAQRAGQHYGKASVGVWLGATVEQAATQLGLERGAWAAWGAAVALERIARDLRRAP